MPRSSETGTTLTVLGSGTMMPSKERHPSAFLLKHGSSKLLLDCGFTTIARLTGWGMDLHSVSVVCITHFHTDHFADLTPLIHARAVDDNQTHMAPRPLLILGPKTLRERLQKLREIFWPEEAYPAIVKEMESADPITIGPWTIAPFPVKHVDVFPSVGYRISDGTKTIVYAGDVGGGEQDAAFDEGIKGADLLVVAAGAAKQPSAHLTVEQALALADRLDVKRVLLTHIEQGRVAEVRTQIAGHSKAELAEDSMRVTL